MKRQSGEGGIVQQPRGRCEQKESSESLTSELSRITIRDATWDQLVQRMKVGDLGHPGIAISWADDATVHACLGVAGAPIPQEANEAASGAALRAWFSGLVVAANANSPVMLAEGIRSSEFFDHLSIDDYAVITRELQPRERCEKKKSSESLTSELSRITIRDAAWGESVQRMEVDNDRHPGIAISWTDDATLHACLGVAGAPIPQEANAAASGAALRAWFSGLVVAANANCRVTLAGGIRSSEFVDHLSMTEFGDITQELHTDPIIMVWGPALHAGGLSAGILHLTWRATEHGGVKQKNSLDKAKEKDIMIRVCSCPSIKFFNRSSYRSVSTGLLKGASLSDTKVPRYPDSKMGKSHNAAAATRFKPQRERGFSSKFGTIVVLQFLTEAAFGIMNPILSIVMTEYFARQHRHGVPIDCGANPLDAACTEGSMQAAWLSSLFSSLGSVFNFFLAPMLGQASDVYGRKPFLVLSQLARVGTPFSIMYFIQPHGSITPYFVLRLIDYGFGTAGVMGAAVADIVPPENRAAAFGILFASLSSGFSLSAFAARFFSREQILQIAAGIFVIRVFWAVCILPETVPKRTRMNKTRWVMESPISSLSILFRNKLFMRLTCLIAITSFIRNGIFQIQSFFLNTIVGFDVEDFANLMLLGGVLALLGQGLLVKTLVSCFKEKGVIIIALIASLMKTSGFAGAAFYPHKWVVFLSCAPGCIGDLTFPAISALKSMNVSEKEQGRLQGAIYGARSIFDAIGPIVFSSLYAAMTRQSLLSEALPYIVASCIYVVGIVVAVALPVSKTSLSPSEITVDPIPLPPPVSDETPSLSSVYFETNDDEMENIDYDGRMEYASNTVLDDDHLLSEPLLAGNTAAEV
ncbi:hypothetical protein PF006_g386 [Phytophthora fragariae]|uniref:Major facilitator superfamily (MFS) profile domain-containing protein n=2 Tax=Phytophthora fragariae TaxID=53985 RepID=A0A6A3UXB7_9STRA|nr:hypothetical protein PF006_g386 [Phytophthora fragariae]